MKKLTLVGIIFLNLGVGAAAFAQEQKAPVLPLDHGPHEQVTPWSNEQTRQRAAAAAKAKSVKSDQLNQSNQSASSK